MSRLAHLLAVTALVLTTNVPARATDLRRDTWLSIVRSHHAVSKCPDSGAPYVPLPSLPDVWYGDVDALVMKYQQNPLRAARAYAYVAVAMRDAWKLSSQLTCGLGRATDAAHLAAGNVVDLLYPQEPPMLWAAVAFARSTAAGREGNGTIHMAAPEYIDSARSVDVVRMIVGAVRQRMLIDGAELRPTKAVAPAQIGRWRGTAPLFSAVPTEPAANRWLPWAIDDVRAWRAPPPPDISSDVYLDQVRTVLDVWRRLTPAQAAVAERWHLDQGSVTPVGVWNRIAREELSESRLTAGERLEMLALLHIAMLDALIVTWDTKLFYQTERPVTAIHRTLDRAFVPHLATPQFPSYVSGHAAVSGAAEVILSAFLPARSAKFKAMADEAALSRLYGGIHFPVDNDEGLALGRRIGAQVLRVVPDSMR